MSLPEPRPSVLAIPAIHSDPPAAPGSGLFMLSYNENPYPPLPGVLEVAAAAAGRMNRYPDMANEELYAALAAHLGVDADQVVASTGSSSFFYQLVQAYCEPGDEVVFAWRAFEAYPVAAAAGAARVVRVPLTPEGRHDLDAMAAAVTDRTRLVIVCTPNNPTSEAVTHAELAAFLRAVPERVVVAVDEAYLEFVRMDDPIRGLALLPEHPNLVLVRTFSKAYGLAGLRVGYAVAAAPVVSALRAVAPPFGISVVAQAAAVASLEHEPALLARVDALVGERDRVVAGLTASGLTLHAPQANFVWLPLRERAAEFAAAARQRGLVIRAFADEGCRVTIGEPEANDRLIELAHACG